MRMPRDTSVALPAVAEFETAAREFAHWADKAGAFIEARFGIGAVDRSCMELLVSRKAGCRPEEIAEYLHLAVGETSALISRLERRGYARRERDSSDLGIVTVHAVADNVDVMAIVNARRAILTGVTQNFTPEEMAVIARYLDYLSSVHPARLVEHAEQKAARQKASTEAGGATPARTQAQAAPVR